MLIVIPKVTIKKITENLCKKVIGEQVKKKRGSFSVFSLMHVKILESNMKYYPENNYKIEKNKLPDFFKTNTVCLNDKG